MITVTRKVFLRTGTDGRKELTVQPPPLVTLPEGRVPRISRLMALAIKFEDLLRAQVVRDQSELARLAYVTQPRMTQILNLNHLAPDIQESLLFLPRVTTGRDPIHEKLLRPICAETDWRKQRRIWFKMRILRS